MNKKWVSIPDVLFFQEGPGVRNTQYTAEGVKLLNVANLVDGKVDLSTSDRYISEEEAYGKYKHFLCNEGDFILASSGIKVEYLDKKMGFIMKEMLPLCMNTSTIRFQVLDKTQLDIRYFMYYVKSLSFKKQVAFHITGSAQLNYGPSHLKKMVMPLIDMEEQKKIIDVLDRISELIEARRQELQKLDSLTKARFVEMFDLENCDYGTFGNDTDFVDYRGKTPKLSDVGSIRMVNAKSVGKGSFKNVNEFVTEDVYEDWMHRGFGYPGDVLFVTEGHTFGNTCLVPDYLDKFALGQRVITIKGHIGTVENAFLCAYMQTDQFWKDINVFRTGGTAQGIRSKDLMKVRLPLPHLDTQKKFVDFINQVYKSKAVVQKALKEYQYLFDSLMQKYFG